MTFDLSNIRIDRLRDELLQKKEIHLSVLRLDTIHPIISGNKIFKLHFFLEEAKKSDHKTIVTFGGAYSNHLAATAYACKCLQLKSIGIIRGEKPNKLSHTLQNCINDGMQLKFISRKDYNEKEHSFFLQKIESEFGNHILIPEGGYHPLGAKGASLISNSFSTLQPTHICSAIGTSTTIAGLLLATTFNQTIVGINILKGMGDIEERIIKLTQCKAKLNQFSIINDYHFGGYAKKTAALISFMNKLYQQHHLPTDFVYTGKMMYAIFDLIEKGYFKKGSKIICIHTGGLQGNLSLPKNTLVF